MTMVKKLHIRKTTYKKLWVRWLQTKPIALNIWIFVSKLMSLLFNMLSRFVITFLLRSKHLLISWLHSWSAVIFTGITLSDSINAPTRLSEVKVKVTQSCPTLCDPMDCIAVQRILQTRILEWVAFPFSRRSSQPRDWTQVSHNEGGFFTSWATREAQEYWSG